MHRTPAALLAVILCLTLLPSVAAAQERSRGISVHMLPKRVADLGGTPWGFTVDHSPRLKAESQQPVFQTVEAVLSFVRKQDSGVQENGLWIVTTNPDAYSEAEKALLEGVKAMCHQEGIPLFICRASELPYGWKRFNQ